MKELVNFDWNLSENTEYFNAEYCKEKTYEAIAAQERDTIKKLILCAAKSGCFSTILPDCHADTRDWLKDLGFQVDYTSQWCVRWYNT
jgi:hypothetical protein